MERGCIFCSLEYEDKDSLLNRNVLRICESCLQEENLILIWNQLLG
jgi:hypothetical protein